MPKDIYIREVEIVDDNFHSRFSAFYKHYDYLVNDGPYSPLLRNYCYQIHDRLDEELMRKATKILEGTHDFTSFNATSISEIEFPSLSLPERHHMHKNRSSVSIKG